MYFVLVSVSIIVFLTISSGVYLCTNKEAQGKEKLKKALGMNLLSFIPLMVLAIIITVPQAVSAQQAVAAGGSISQGMGYIAAALSTGFATIGTGIAVASVGSAALGAISEDESILGKTLIFVGLAEGIAIYGLIISILIFGSL